MSMMREFIKTREARIQDVVAVFLFDSFSVTTSVAHLLQITTTHFSLDDRRITSAVVFDLEAQELWIPTQWGRHRARDENGGPVIS
jgi:hypothetical protein